MKRFLSLLFMCFLLSAPALAQITIINKDGSRTTFNPHEKNTEEQTKPQSPKPEEKTAAPPKPQTTTSEPAPPPAPETVSETVPESSKTKQNLAPVPKATLNPAKSAPQKPIEDMHAEPAASKQVIRDPPPVPPYKPLAAALPRQATHEEQTATPAMIVPPNPRHIKVINQNTAIGIALDHAPPAKDFKVSAYDFKGTPAYSVLFKTENGPYEVIIDAVKGRVLDKGYLQ